MFHRRRSASGFTLVELLVVIGIIALLAALLLPVLARATASAKSARCKSRLGQYYKGIRMYLSNFDEFFPVGFHKGASGAGDLGEYSYYRFSIYEYTDSSFNHIVITDSGAPGYRKKETTTQSKFKRTRIFWECPAQGWTKEYFASSLVFKDAGSVADYDQHTQYNALVAKVSSTERPMMTDVDASYAQGAGAYSDDEYKSTDHKGEVETGWTIVDDSNAESGKDIFKGVGNSLRTAGDYKTERFDFRHNGSINIIFLDSHVIAMREGDGAKLKRIYDRWDKMNPPTTP